VEDSIIPNPILDSGMSVATTASMWTQRKAGFSPSNEIQAGRRTLDLAPSAPMIYTWTLR
jgi:hypothetical protein